MKRLAATLFLAAGCSSYEPEPLDGRAILEQLRALRLEAPPEGLDPAESVAIALVNNPGLRALRREHEVAENLVLSAAAWQNPELRFDLENIVAAGANPLLLAAGLRIFPPVPGENDAKVARAQALEKKVMAQIEDREMRLAAETRIAHAKLRMIEEKIRILEAAERLHQGLVTVIEQRIANQASTRLDGSLAALKRAEIENERLTLEAQHGTAAADLAALLGASPAVPIKVKKGTPLSPPAELAQDKMEEDALKDRADLRALKEQYEAREQSLRLAHLARVFWPRFLQPGAERVSTDPQKHRGLELEAGFELPIFNGGGAEIAVAEAERRQARDAYAAKLHAARSEIRQAALRVREEERRRRFYEERVEPALKEAEGLVRESLQAGEADALKLVAIESRALDARRQAAQSAFDYEQALVHLKLATGGILKP